MNRNKRAATVRDQIFSYNTRMILVLIGICGGIGLIVLKVYWERQERMLESMVDAQFTGGDVENLIESITFHNTSFNMMALLFVLFCVVSLIIVSRIFTSLLAAAVMEPLSQLEDAAARIQGGVYNVPISYEGNQEFEQVCAAFNNMQAHLLAERERNARYERARQEMIAGISHDLRSPLTAIRGSVKGVLDGIASTPEQQTRFLETAYRRSGDMDRLLTELFYFSRLETGGIPVNVQSLDLAAFLTSYLSAKQDQPDLSGISLEYDALEDAATASGAVMAEVDPEALERILDNVITNSMKYADALPLRMHVGLEQDGGLVRVTLQDNGGGVTADQLPHLFEEFYRADESRNRKDGSGLGLYIVKYLMDAMQGSVSADMESHCDGFKGLAIVLTFRAA